MWPRRIFLASWLTYTVFWTPYIVREHFPAMTLAESGTLNVVSYLGWTEDIFRGPRGGAYINNNPGAPLAGALPLILFRPVLAKLQAWNRSHARQIGRNDGDLFWRACAEGKQFYFLAAGFLTVALVMAPGHRRHRWLSLRVSDARRRGRRLRRPRRAVLRNRHARAVPRGPSQP